MPEVHDGGPGSLADLFAGRVGRIRSGGKERLSEECGAKFTDYQALHPDAPVSDAPALTVSRNIVVAAWHAKSGEGRRVYYRASEDRGVTFGSVQELSAPAGNASLPVLAAAPDGRVHLAWQHDDTIRTLAIELPQKRVAAAHTVERR